MRYFLVKTLDGAGLTDQLATQFSRLYSLGMACHYEYVHSPFAFPRCHGYTWQLRAIKKFERYLHFNFPGILRLHTVQELVATLFRCCYKAVSVADSQGRSTNEELSHFLGLNAFANQITDARFSACARVRVDVSQILEDPAIEDVSQLQHVIEQGPPAPTALFEFAWTGRMYDSIPRLDALLTRSGVESLELAHLKLAENYWKGSRRPPCGLADSRGKKLNLVVHMRLGDSAVLELDKKPLYVIDSYVRSRESLDATYFVDPNRRPIQLHEYEVLLAKLYAIWGRENVFCTVLSDGYDRTFNIVTNCLANGQLKLSSLEMRLLPQMERAANSALAEFLRSYSDASVIGECFDDLLKCIHCITTAEVLIYGTGGFACYTHQLFKKPHQPSRLLHVRNTTAEELQAMCARKP